MPRSPSTARSGNSPKSPRATIAPKPVPLAIADGFATVESAATSLQVVASGDLPRILFIEQLAPLIGKTATTIRTCATNAKYAHLIPRPFKMPGSRRLCWYEADVLAWIESTRPVEPPPPRRPRGRPTKAEQLARQRWANTATEGR
jgi:predicted DNA-binding transcriptional regulator AlpA